MRTLLLSPLALFPLLLSLPLLSACPPAGDDSPSKDQEGTKDDSEGDPPEAEDADGDGHASDVDCDDGDASVNPGVASDVCDEVDQDCDGQVDEDPDVSWYADRDQDGFGGGTATVQCAPLANAVTNDADCDDEDILVGPGADETCNQADDDCDGEVDEGFPSDVEIYVDADGDGAGDPDRMETACGILDGYVDNGHDCDDRDVSTPVWVDASAGRVSDGTLASPFPSIQQGIDSGSRCVMVRAGYYYEALKIGRGPTVVESVDGAELTTIDAAGGGPVVTVESSQPGTRIAGFTLTGGTGLYSYSTSVSSTSTYYYYDYQGGGVYVANGDLAIEDSVLTANHLLSYYYSYNSYDAATGTYYYYYTYQNSYGGGIYAYDSTVVVEDTRIEDNAAGTGAGIYQGAGDLSVTRTGILGNYSAYDSYDSYAVYADAATSSFTNVLFDANQDADDFGYGIYTYEGAVLLQNVTMVSQSLGVYSYGGDVTVDSSIIGEGEYGVYVDGGTLSITWSDLYDLTSLVSQPSSAFTTGRGNISEDPMFVRFVADNNPNNDDLALAAGSPAIDAGSSAAGYEDVDGSRNDMGAFGGPNGDWL